jgi:phage shock protein A
VLGRLINLLKAKLNKGMAELETPEILAEQALEQLEANIKKVKDGVVASLTMEKSIETKLKKSQEEIGTWEKRAAVAVQQNNDELARQCLQKKQELNQSIATLTPQLEAQKQSTVDLKAKYKELEEQLRGFHQKKANLLAREKASDASSKANELIGASGGSGTAKWEQKIEEKEFKAEAMRQMSGSPSDAKFANLDQHFEVEDELASLKAQVAPKLIVDTGSSGAQTPGKTVVDENVPMVVEEVKKDDKNGDK